MFCHGWFIASLTILLEVLELEVCVAGSLPGVWLREINSQRRGREGGRERERGWEGEREGERIWSSVSMFPTLSTDQRASDSVAVLVPRDLPLVVCPLVQDKLQVMER